MISYKNNRGVGLIEVLVALLVTLIGILGFIGLQARSQQSDLESFQREQALRIVDFMVNQINNNRPAARCYALASATTATTHIGTGFTGPYACTQYGDNDAQRAQVVADMTEWDNMLKGASETLGGTNVGSMIGARGCITFTEKNLAASPVIPNDRMTISVAWQGLMPSAVPTDTCGIVAGVNLYGDNNLRRVMSMDVDLSDLN